jgi:DNA repair protein RadA/Sms
MVKKKTVYTCQSCGYQSRKWLGRCPDCSEWQSFVEEFDDSKIEAPGQGAFGAINTSRPQKLSEVEGADVTRQTSGIGELDRVLGGGMVKGTLVLLGGDPGIGKSTLLLQTTNACAQQGMKVLYVTGEESPRQTKMRFDRIGADAKDLWIVADTSVERIESHVQTIQPDLLIIDSIQTLFTSGITSSPGSVSQLRASTGRMMAIAKGLEITTFLVGHVTKDGAIAGPRVLEHMVDTVLQFEGQRGQPFRLLRAIKNRFGSTDELGTFEMQERGMVEVTNPSEFFLSERAKDASGSVVSCSYEGTRPLLVEVQALVCPTVYGNPRRTTLGVDGNRVAMLLAILEKKAGLDVAGADVFLNVAGGLRLDEPAVDLGVLISLASSHIDRPVDPFMMIFGEVGLSGEIRAVNGAPSRVAEARQLGFQKIILPKNNLSRMEEIPEGVELIGVDHVVAALDVIFY